MKLSKVLLGSAVAVALVVGFTGCMDEVGNDLFKYSDASYESANGTATIDYDNTEEDSIKRGIKFLRAKHEGLTALITIENQDNKSLDGMLGIAFGAVEKETDDTKLWDFCIAGTQSMYGKGNAYVSSFHNIGDENLDAKNFGANKTENSYKENATESYEIEIAKYNSTAKYVNSVVIDDNGNYVIAMKITPITNDENGKSNGGYNITFYNAKSEKDITDSNIISSASWSVENTMTGLDNSDQKIGFYANVYAGKTLKGSIKLFNAEGNPIPIEWDDTIEASPLFN